LKDADILQAAEHGAMARCLNSGQSCIAAKRFIVEDAVYDEFVHQFRKQMATRVLGDPMSEETTLGPLAREDFVVALHDQVERSVKMGAQRLAGGKLSDLGPCYYPATVLSDVEPGMPVFDEETFGPVAAIIRAEDLEHAITLANQSIYGLGASVWTSKKDVSAIAERLQCGHVAFNGIVKSDPRLPFGGIKESGYGRELGVPGLLSFVNIKTIWKK
jgi:succinate-semialdehyde dehydrogenase/glutarate-semialdehyde dehydrogenase